MANKAAANKAKNAGNVNFKNGKYEEALKNYDDAVRLDPEEVIYFEYEHIGVQKLPQSGQKLSPFFAAASDFHKRT